VLRPVSSAVPERGGGFYLCESNAARSLHIRPCSRVVLRRVLIALLVLVATKTLARAAEGREIDVHKFRTTAVWWFSQPSGSFTGKANSGTFDLSRDFGFGDYSTSSGMADWKFKRKHHLRFGVSPVSGSRTATLQRTIEFQGVTYEVGRR